MSNKSALPPIDAELEPPRHRVDLKAIRPKGQADDATIEENSRRLGSDWGASTTLQPPGPGPTFPRAPRHPSASRFRPIWTMSSPKGGFPARHKAIPGSHGTASGRLSH